MMYERFEKENTIEKVSISKEEIKELVEIANRDISTANYVMAHDIDWALAIAYNSVHQMLLAIMYKEDFRPKGGAKHKATIDFCLIALGDKYRAEIDIIDKLRKKRNKAVYHHIKTVSELEAKEAIRFAKEFVDRIIKDKIKF